MAFTGTSEEAAEYMKLGFYIGLTGTICMERRGETLRRIVSARVRRLSCPFPLHLIKQAGETAMIC